MGNEILVPSIFEHEEFGKVRVLLIDGEPWFVGRDVCNALGYANSRKALIDHVPDKFKRVINDKTLEQMASQSKGNESLLLEFDSPRGLTFVNEPGLYRLILRSNLPAAEEFSDWICEKVVPSILRTGSYTLPSAAENKQTDLLTVFAEFVALEREKFIVANSEETKTFAKAQLLRELASASGDNQSMRNDLIRQAAKLLIGEDFDMEQSKDFFTAKRI